MYNTHTHTHSHKHTLAHTSTHSHTHTSTHSHTHTNTLTCSQAYTRTYTHTLTCMTCNTAVHFIRSDTSVPPRRVHWIPTATVGAAARPVETGEKKLMVFSFFLLALSSTIFTTFPIISNYAVVRFTDFIHYIPSSARTSDKTLLNHFSVTPYVHHAKRSHGRCAI